jgi:RNA polymerase sigma-70 factor (ECF subfamily)
MQAAADAEFAATRHPPVALDWSELLSHRAYLVRYAQRKLQDPALAEDVVHDVFEAVLRGRAAFAGASALLALECPQPRPDELAEQREHLSQTLRRIDALPSGLRDVMRLRVLSDQPTEAVCQALRISEENLFVRLHRARKQLLC